MESLMDYPGVKKQAISETFSLGGGGDLCNNTAAFDGLTHIARLAAVRGLAQNPCEAQGDVTLSGLPDSLLREILHIYGDAQLGVCCKSTSTRQTLLSTIRRCFKVNTECSSGPMQQLSKDSGGRTQIEMELKTNFADKISTSRAYKNLEERVAQHQENVTGVLEIFDTLLKASVINPDDEVANKATLAKHLQDINCKSRNDGESKRLLLKICETLNFECCKSLSVPEIIKRIKNVHEMLINTHNLDTDAKCYLNIMVLKEPKCPKNVDGFTQIYNKIGGNKEHLNKFLAELCKNKSKTIGKRFLKKILGDLKCKGVINKIPTGSRSKKDAIMLAFLGELYDNSGDTRIIGVKETESVEALKAIVMKIEKAGFVVQGCPHKCIKMLECCDEGSENMKTYKSELVANINTTLTNLKNNHKTHLGTAEGSGGGLLIKQEELEEEVEPESATVQVKPATGRQTKKEMRLAAAAAAEKGTPEGKGTPGK
jgi:hypothetical protein